MTPQFYQKVIRMYVDHLLGPAYVLGSQDYGQINRAFKEKGGSWEAVAMGSLEQNELLENLVKAWGETLQARVAE